MYFTEFLNNISLTFGEQQIPQGMDQLPDGNIKGAVQGNERGNLFR